MNKTVKIAALAALCIAAFIQNSVAQTYPSKPVRMITPNGAGGPSDLVARVLAQAMSESWGQQVIVENRVGAGGNVGTEAAARAAPDGYTILLANAAPLVVNQWLYAKVPYDSSRDFAAVILIGNSPLVLVVSNQLGVNSVAELVRLAKSRPGKLTFSSVGSGSGPSLAAEILKLQAGIDIVHVPYRTPPQALGAVVSGEVSFAFHALNALQLAQAGKMKAIGMTSKKRSVIAPDVPAVSEAGYPDYDFGSWYALLAPAGTPRDIILRLHRESERAMVLPDFRTRMMGIGVEGGGGTPEELGSLIRNESAQWGKVIAAAGLKAD